MCGTRRSVGSLEPRKRALGKYLSVGSPSRTAEVSIDFSLPINYYGLYLGSPDGYNSFTFYETGNPNTPIATFTGAQLVAPGLGDQSIGRYINFRISGGSISRIVLSSSQAGARERQPCV